MKKWSIWLKWLGARISGPDFGTFSTPIARDPVEQQRRQRDEDRATKV